MGTTVKENPLREDVAAPNSMQETGIAFRQQCCTTIAIYAISDQLIWTTWCCK